MASSLSLMERLTKEIECSVCMEIYTDPKTLPCLHTFCLHCLNRLAERRVNQEPIVCPDCRTQIALPEGGNFDAFPSSFYLNRLRDIVSTQDEGHHVLCASCNKKSAATAFCFNCQCFICDECQELHSRIKIWEGHRLTTLSEVQDADVQQILGRPQLCEEPRHTTEVLEFFCETCQRCICQKCAIMTRHKSHDVVDVDDAADQAKLRLEENKKKVQGGVRTCKERLNKDQKTHRKLEEQVAAAELSAQRNTQRFIDLAKQHEREVMTKLATIREDQGREFEGRKEKLELRLGQLSSVTDFLESVLKRGSSGEILRAESSVGNRSGELLKTLEELQPVKSQRVKYMPNENVYHSVEQVTLGRVVVAQVADPEKTQIQGFEKQPIFISECAQFTVVTQDNEGNVCYLRTNEVTVQILTPAGDDVENEIQDKEDGSYSVSFTPKTAGVHHVIVKVQGQSPAHCRVDVTVTRRIHSYKHLSSFGSHGSGDGQFQCLVDISVSSTGERTVSDQSNHRVQIFSDTGQFLRKFGTKGLRDGQFQYPTGVAYNKTGNIVVSDQCNSRIQVFSSTGQWIRKFGGEVLKGPCGVSVTSDNNIVVCDLTVKKVFVFSPEGKLLLQFAKNQVSSQLPYAIFHDGKYFVSTGQQVVRVFDSHGAHLYDIGRGQLRSPTGLAVDTNNLLLVCDYDKCCVQVLTLDGKFVTSFGSPGTGEGQFNCPYGITITPDGRVFVCDGYNHRIQVFQPQY